MVVVERYADVKKRGADGRYKTFTALRAAGLALEKGFRICKQLGLSSLQQHHLSTVAVAGDLQLRETSLWRKSRSCTLKVCPVETQLVQTAVFKVRALLGDLGLNIWDVDLQVPGVCSMDLVCDFNYARHCCAPGKLWLELKLFAAEGCRRQAALTKDWLKETLPKVQAKDPSVGGVALLVVKVEKEGVAWGRPALLCELLQADGDWRALAGSDRVGRGQVAGEKPTFAKVWSKMQKTVRVGGRSVKLLKHFLEALDLPVADAGKRAATFNKILAKSGSSGRLQQKNVPNISGIPPWVGTKDVFRSVYKLV